MDMVIRGKSARLMVALAAFAAGESLAADALSKDLTSTIALLGLPCGQVVSAKRLGENDYLATCQDKNRYRVYVNAQGRVVAQKQ
jgi:hypothetical protein